MASNSAMTTARFLMDCPSPQHRAVAGALRLALTGDLAPGVEDDCARTDPMVFAEIAQSHFVDTALAPAFAESGPIAALFPEDLALFFGERAAANGRRNERLKAQLEMIGAAFVRDGIAAVALKGATELVDPWWRAPSGRYLSDLDLLVSENVASRASKILASLGAEQPNTDEGPSDHHHLPPFLAPDWEAMVELHIHIGDPAIAARLPEARVLNEASPSHLPGILLPKPEDRLMHLLLHAPKGGFGARGGRLYLREIANIWAAQEHLGEAALNEVEDKIATHDGPGKALPYGELVDAKLGARQRPSSRAARSALTRFGRPEQDSRRETLTWGYYYLKQALTDKTRRSEYLAKVTRKGGLKALRAFHKRRRNMTR